MNLNLLIVLLHGFFSRNSLYTVDTIPNLLVRTRWLLSLFLSNRINLIISGKSFLLIVFEKNAGLQILFYKYETSKFFA